MSRQEAVAAFLAGRISRRTLIRNLVAGGVSVGAATSYAQMLDPEEADAALPAAAGDDLYPLVTLEFKPQTLADVLSSSKVKLVGTCGEEVGLGITVYVRKGAGLKLIGSRGFPLFLTAAGSNTVTITVDTTLLQGQTKATLYAYALGADNEQYGAVATAKLKLA